MKKLAILGGGGYARSLAEDAWQPVQADVQIFGPQDDIQKNLPLLAIYPNAAELKQVMTWKGPVRVFPRLPDLPTHIKTVNPWAYFEPVQKAKKIVRENALGKIVQWHGRACWLGDETPPKNWWEEALLPMGEILGASLTCTMGFGGPGRRAGVWQVDGKGDLPLGSLETIVMESGNVPKGSFPFSLSFDMSGGFGIMKVKGIGEYLEQDVPISMYRQAHEHQYPNLEGRIGVALLKAASAGFF